MKDILVYPSKGFYVKEYKFFNMATLFNSYFGFGSGDLYIDNKKLSLTYDKFYDSNYSLELQNLGFPIEFIHLLREICVHCYIENQSGIKNSQLNKLNIKIVGNDVIFKMYIKDSGHEDRSLDIHNALNQNKKEIVKKLRSVAQSIDEAHNHGILHRDIKPGNIFVTKEGELLLGDWGLARIGGYTLKDGCIKASYLFAAPECFAAHKDLDFIDKYTDIYSFAKVLLWTIFHDNRIFSDLFGADISKLMEYSALCYLVFERKSGYYQIDPLESKYIHFICGLKWEYIPFAEALYDLFSKALNPNKDLRFNSAMKLYDEFVNVLDVYPAE